MSENNPTGAELLAQIKPRLREKGTGICLRPDLLDEWEDEDQKLTEMRAKDQANPRLAAGVSAATKKQAQKVRELEEQIDATELRFVFRALPKDQYQALKDANPPRPDDQVDLFAGYNRVAVGDASVRRSLISPVFEDCTQGTPEEPCPHTDCGSWQQFLAVCNTSEWDELRRTADEVNGAVLSAPKSRLASQILDKGGATSRRRAAGE